MALSASPEHHKVIVLGAGFNGISIAKTYLEIDPSVDILLVDCGSSVGGVWSKERIYSGLHYEAPTPLLNYSDFDMCKEFEMEEWSDVSGDRVNEFLVRYATKFDLISRCRFKTMALKIERNVSGWTVLAQSTINGWTTDKTAPLQTLTCDKLILATGITSTPYKPAFDLSSFNGLEFHSAEMGRRQGELTADSVNHVTVIGGHKSALEVVGTCAQAGKKVEWLMRADGGGPTWLFPSKSPDGTSLAKLSGVRALSVVGLSVYSYGRWLNRFLHSGRFWLGTWLMSWFWVYMTNMMLGDKYSKSENGRKLKPETDRDLETLRLVDEGKLIRIDRAHLISAKDHKVTIDTSATIETDAIVWCTGWGLSNLTVVPPYLANELGLPVKLNAIPPEEKEYWDTLDTEASDRILKLYHVLRSPPNAKREVLNVSPFRLFRFIIPPKLAARGDNSIVIIGNYASGQVQLASELSSLFAVAYLEDILPASTKSLLRDAEAMNRDIAHVDAFRRKRYLGWTPYRVSILESMEYDDQLMGDLGLRADRKRLRTPEGWTGWFGLKAWYREWFEPYSASDYKGIIQEFMAGVEQRKGKLNGGVNALPNGVAREAANGFGEA